MKRLAFLLCAWMLMFSCAHDADEIVAPSPEPLEPVSPYAVSVEEALSALYAVLEQIDGNDETRSGLMRHALTVGEVKVSDLGCFTRSELPDADNLLYVVSFGEGNGSAVLGADSRVEPVLAILDETVLTSEDFGPDKESLSEIDDLKAFLTEGIVGAAETQVLGRGISLPPSEELLRGQVITRITDKYVCAPRLKTKWNQNAPYNNSVPDRYDGNGKCFAGCVPIAVTQFLYNMQYSGSNRLFGRTYDWNLIKECEYGSVPSNEAKQEIADYIATIGMILQTDYHYYLSEDQPEVAATYLSYAVNLFEEFGVSSQYAGFNTSLARSIVCEKGPICVCGSNAGNSGHAWVVDGWNSYIEKKVMALYNSFGVLVREAPIGETEVKLLHCNYGWGGICDGYYSYSILVFDASSPLDDENIDYENGDLKGGEYIPGRYTYDRNLYMISY